MGKEYESYGVLGKPQNDLEEEIAQHIYPLLTTTDEERIKNDKLTLSGCMENCMKKGHKFEIKTGKSGIARISPEQHWKWVCEYFGIAFSMPSLNAAPAVKPAKEEPAIDQTLSDLLNF